MLIYLKNHNEKEENLSFFVHVELLEHLVDGVAVSVVADGLVVTLGARATTSSSLGDWSSNSEKNEKEKAKNIHLRDDGKVKVSDDFCNILNGLYTVLM
ncbi:hypothetical protein L3Y34_000934 [Caenorhabditis briggsae]|uniref:Uncharacterized protein n=1 Tax=Caenorhabditis briggsae TaxID=6238 RepID=A0AAE9DAX1_CAEBR|nr:hypothetical protein L3Y34_000934 [Caenorhabditis briggsae]